MKKLMLTNLMIVLPLLFGAVSVYAQVTDDHADMQRVPIEDRPDDPDLGGGGGGGSGVSSAMDIDAFQRLAFSTDTSGRCMDIGIGPNECRAELDYALTNGLITRRAYDWAQANGYYPVINRHGLINAICKCGCFEAETQISARINGVTLNVAAKDISKAHQLLALDSDASRQALHQSYYPVQSLTKGPEYADLYQFELSNGKALTVSQHHGMVVNEGRVVAAKDVTAQDHFIAASGEVVTISAISRLPATADVVNFETDGPDAVNHIIVAEGVLVGDLSWQNQRAADLGRIAIRQ